MNLFTSRIRRSSLPQVLFALVGLLGARAVALQFEVGLDPSLSTNALSGRLILILAQDQHDEPRLAMEHTDPGGPFVFGCDATALSASRRVTVGDAALGNRLKLSELPAGKYFVQGLLDLSTEFRSVNAEGNLISEPQEMQLDPRQRTSVKLTLTRRIPPQPARESELVKFVRIQSPRLSEFHGRPVFLNAGIILPASYHQNPERRYPLWIHVGGYGARYTRAADLMATGFRQVWRATNAPQMIYVQADGAGPLGDPYQINSANNGPYGHAFVWELLPAIEQAFRGQGGPKGRVLSGRSTGGWVALALQIFYPDEFAGAWAASPDPVDFRAFQLLNLDTDQNAYVNAHGEERPAARDLNGDVRLSVRREVRNESVLAPGGQWTRSGQQWGAWNAVFSSRGPDGLPVPLWDDAGKVNATVAEHWKKYDLRRILEARWAELAPRLRGRLHISVGEADDYFLNNAVHLLEAELAKREPKDVATFSYGPGQGHGWMGQGLAELIAELHAATQSAP